MQPSFGFFSDPGLTTKLRGRVMMTVDSTGNGSDIVVYFGSPISSRYCEAADGGDITVSVSGTGAAGVLISTSADVFSGSQSISLGTRLNGGAANVIPLYFRSDAGNASPDVTLNLLAEYQP